MIRKTCLVSGVAAALILGVASSASAGTLDQQQTSSSTDAGLFATQSVAQTFTAGITGSLDQAALLVFKSGTPAEPLIVEVRNTSAGAPGTSVLASASIPTSAIGTAPATFVPVTFTTPSAVTAGTQYALVAYTTHVTNDWGGWRYQAATNPYSGGSGFSTNDPVPPMVGWNQQPNNDYAFKTYVTPPPSPSPPNTGQPTKKKCKKKKHKHHAASAKKHCKKKK